MTVRCREWLPLSTISDSRVKERVSAIAGRWAERWFAPGICAVSDCEVREQRRPPVGLDLAWRDFGHGVCLLWGEAKALEWARETINMPGDISLTVEDGALLTRLAENMAQELANDLGDALLLDAGGQKQPVAGPWLEMTLVRTACKKIPLRISVSACALVRFRKSLVASKPTDSLPGNTLEAAISGQTLSYEAVLGGARMKAAELCALAPGDVILLDRSLSEPVDIVSLGGGAIVGRAMLDQAGSDARLTIVQV